MIRAQYIPGVVEKAGVVAIAEVTAAAERVATFRIEEALKGPGAGELIRVDNRTAYTGEACSPYDEEFGEGFRFRHGDTKVLILEKEVDGLWQVAFGSDTAWDAPSNDLQPLIQDFWVDQTPKPRLDAVRGEIQEAAPILGKDLDWEGRNPCNNVPGVDLRVATATLVVVADVTPANDRATARIVEVLAGEYGSDSLTFNHRARRDWESCDVVLEPPFEYQQLAGRQLLYLRPDEFGVAEFRPTFWGSAHEAVNEQYVTHGLPTLWDIRQAAAGQPVNAVGPRGDGAGSLPGITAAGLLGACALAFALWSRKRARGGAG